MPLLLVVDEDEEARRSLTSLLEEARHELTDCPPAGIEAALAERAPNAILFSLAPDHEDELQLIRRLKAAGREFIPLLVIGAKDDKIARRAALRAGADEYLGRPFSLEELDAHLGLLLDVRAHRQALARKQAELAVLQEFREDLANLLVHDLKDPLGVATSSLAGLTELLRGQTEALEGVRAAQRAVGVLERVISNLLDVGQAEGGRIALQRSRFTVAELFAAIARTYEQGARMRNAALEVTAVDVTLEADRDMLRRVFENLLENALRYVNPGGRIVLHATIDEDRVLLAAANTGPPVPLENRRVIFEKFGHLRRHSGVARMDLGLGLYFCRLVVEAHDGTIHVEETAEFPTVFLIDLPGRRG